MTRWIALVLALVMVAGACGDDDGGGAFGGGGGDGDLEAFCDIAQDQEDLDNSIDEGDVNIFEPEAFREAFEELLELTDRAAAVAPAEIRDDFETLRSGLRDVRDALDEAGYDFTAVDPAIFEEENAEMDAASDRIEAFIERECGIGGDDDEPSDSGSDDGSSRDTDDSAAPSGLVAEAFVEAGLSVGQANCLAESVSITDLLELGTSADDPPPAFFEALDTCGVSLQQLAELGAMGGDDLGDMDLGEQTVEGLLDDMPTISPPAVSGDLPPEAIDLFVSELVSQGFTEAEARCLVGPILTDPGSGDPLQAFEDCGISLSRLAELGG